jgi:polynucleotide 5'-kinase involved in rRNA processing
MKSILAQASSSEKHAIESAKAILIIGAPDRGKSTLTQEIVDLKVATNERVGLIDGDIGQNRLGPPMCIWAAEVSCSGQEKVFGFFIGSLSPAGYSRAMASGFVGGLCSLRSRGLVQVLADTPGLLFGAQGLELQLAYLEALSPDLIIALGQRNELRGIIEQLGLTRFQGGLLRLSSPTEFQPSTILGRKDAQQESLAAYFEGGSLETQALGSMRAWFLGEPLSPSWLQRFTGHYGALVDNLIPTIVQVVHVSRCSLTIRFPATRPPEAQALVLGAVYDAPKGGLAHRPDFSSPLNACLNCVDVEH